MLELYRNIKKYRKLNNTTQLELAEAIGYSECFAKTLVT